MPRTHEMPFLTPYCRKESLQIANIRESNNDYKYAQNAGNAFSGSLDNIFQGGGGEYPRTHSSHGHDSPRFQAMLCVSPLPLLKSLDARLNSLCEGQL
jgi:hypothetical protein